MLKPVHANFIKQTSTELKVSIYNPNNIQKAGILKNSAEPHTPRWTHPRPLKL